MILKDIAAYTQALEFKYSLEEQIRDTLSEQRAIELFRSVTLITEVRKGVHTIKVELLHGVEYELEIPYGPYDIFWEDASEQFISYINMAIAAYKQNHGPL